MKQVSYDFDWWTVAGALVVAQGVEDGFWQIQMKTESVTINIPPVVEGSTNSVLPGHIVRVVGLKLVKSPTLDYLCVEVKDGLIVEIGDGINRNQSGPVESDESTGENSSGLGESISVSE